MAKVLCPECEGNGQRPLRDGAGRRIGIEVCPRCRGFCVVDDEREAPH